VNAPWTQSWNSYLATASGVLLFQRIDLEAEQHAPVRTHPVALLVDVRLKHPGDDGQRTPEEIKAILQYEEALVDMVENLVDGIFWGLKVTDGTSTFEFYLAPAEGKEIATKLSPITEIPGYRPTLRIIQDPEWTEYQNAYPSDFHLQTMHNRGVQRALQDAGDSLLKPRRIDHTVIFPSPRQAKSALPGLRGARFHGFRLSPSADNGCSLTFRRRDVCDGAKPDDIMIEILDIVEEFAGRYDGWGCMAQL
jgi:hypothetical protein